MLTKAEIEIALNEWFEEAHAKGASYIDVNAGALHRHSGGFPLPRTGLAACCDVMREVLRQGDDTLGGSIKGNRVSITIRYQLPR